MTSKTEAAASSSLSLFSKMKEIVGPGADPSVALFLFFIKRASDKWEKEYASAFNQALSEGVPEEYARQEAKKFVYHDVDIPEAHLWRNIIADADTLSSKLQQELKLVSSYDPAFSKTMRPEAISSFLASTTNNEKSKTRLPNLIELLSGQNLVEIPLPEVEEAYESVFYNRTGGQAAVAESRNMLLVLCKVFEPRDPHAMEERYDPAAEGG